MDGTDTDELSVQGAVDKLDKALAYDAPLRMRGEGLSWMVWGLVGAVVVLGESVAHDRLPEMGYQLWMATIIPIFASMAVLGTAAVWRLAGVARPALTPTPSKVALGGLALAIGAVLVSFGWVVVNLTGSYAGITIAIATIPWGLLGWAQWNRMTRAGRRAMIIAGVVMAILLTTYMELAVPDDDLTGFFIGVVLFMAGIPFFLGLVWTFRR